jgi:hypothetical protein
MLILISLTLALASSVASRLLDHNQANSRPASNKHIVKLKSEINALAADSIKASFTNTLSHEYSMEGFEAFAGTFTPEELACLQASDKVRDP